MYTSIHIYKYTCILVCMYTCILVYMYASIHVYMYVYINICVYKCKYVQMYTFILNNAIIKLYHILQCTIISCIFCMRVPCKSCLLCNQYRPIYDAIASLPIITGFFTVIDFRIRICIVNSSQI